MVLSLCRLVTDPAPLGNDSPCEVNRSSPEATIGRAERAARQGSRRHATCRIMKIMLKKSLEILAAAVTAAGRS